MAPDPTPYKPTKQHVVASGVHAVRLQPEPRRVRMTFIGDNYTASRLIDLIIDDCLSLCTLDVADVEPAEYRTWTLLTCGYFLGFIGGLIVASIIFWL